MEWHDEAIIIGLIPHGETSLIVELMTREHGRHKGLVRGGKSKKNMPLMQAGNKVKVQWWARLSEHMGQYKLEALDYTAAKLMQSPLSLYALQNITQLLRLLPERDPHSVLYEALPLLLTQFDDPLLIGEVFARFELSLLKELGFGLDLEKCAATGKLGQIAYKNQYNKEDLDQNILKVQTADLAYVSPKTGRAVDRVAGEPWKDKLLVLPAFLLSSDTRAENLDVLEQAFYLTGYFLARNVLEPRNFKASPFRETFIRNLQEEVKRQNKT